MKKRAYIFYLGIFMSGVAIAFFMGRKFALTDSPATQANVNTMQSHTKGDKTKGFWLKLENDVIVIYEENKNDMIAQTDIRGEDCSGRDRTMLRDGVYMESMEKLFKFLQAHTS